MVFNYPCHQTTFLPSRKSWTPVARYWQSVGYEEVTVGLLGWAEVLVAVDTEVGVTAGEVVQSRRRPLLGPSPG